MTRDMRSPKTSAESTPDEVCVETELEQKKVLLSIKGIKATYFVSEMEGKGTTAWQEDLMTRAEWDLMTGEVKKIIKPQGQDVFLLSLTLRDSNQKLVPTEVIETFSESAIEQLAVMAKEINALGKEASDKLKKDLGDPNSLGSESQIVSASP